jgi:hypothetical protein
MQTNTKLYSVLYIGNASIVGTQSELDSKAHHIHETQLLEPGYANFTTQVDECFYNLEQKTNSSTDDLICYAFADCLDSETLFTNAVLERKIAELPKELHFNVLGCMLVPEVLSQKYGKDSIIVEVKKDSLILYYNNETQVVKNIISMHDSEGVYACVEEFALAHSIDTTKVVVYASAHGLHVALDTKAWSEEGYDEASLHVLSFRDIEHLLFTSLKHELNMLHSSAGKDVVEKAVPVEKEHAPSVVHGFAVSNLHSQTSELSQESEDENEEEATQEQEDIQEENVPKKKFGLPLHFNASSIVSLFFTHILGLLGLLFMFVSIGLYDSFVHSMQLTVYTPLQTIKVPMTLPPATTSTLVTKVEDIKEFTKTIPTTGKKSIGEKAKGKVKIFNCTDNVVSFTKGSALSVNSKKFTLIDSVDKLGSASGSFATNNRKCTETSSDVTAEASDIGEDFNIVEGSVLNINTANKNDFYAKSISAFTGGVKKDGQVVDTKDIEELKKLLASENNAKSGSTPVVANILPSLTDTSGSKTSFSAKVGDLVKEVTITSKGKIIYYNYKKDELEKYISTTLKSNPALQSSVIKRIAYSIDAATKAKNNDITINTSVNVEYGSAINTAELSKEVVNKTFPLTLPGVTSFDIVSHNPLPFNSKTPKNDKNISIVQQYK